MRITIIGAGILGKDLASTLCNDHHDVVIIDKQAERLDILREHLDVMTCHGNGASAQILKQVEINQTDLFIAVTGDEASNILACQLARQFGVTNSICRLSSEELFSYEDNITPETLGLENIVVPELECVNKIIDAVKNHSILEKIRFSNPNAFLTAFEVKKSSPMNKLKLSEFPNKDIVNSIRFSAVVRNGLRITPRGNTVIKKGDEVYVAGHRDKVQKFIDWATNTQVKPSKIIIAGATLIGQQLAKKLSQSGYRVRVIDIDRYRGEELLDKLDTNLMVICGDTTEKEVLEEAGIESCDIFISALKDDEDNILSCILAKKMGAKKVITITNKSEYIDIVPSIKMIDCGFSASLVASNTVLRSLNNSKHNVSIEAAIHRIQSYIYEYEVVEKSPCNSVKIGDIKCPNDTTFALVFRGNDVLSATGELTFQTGDIVAVISTKEMESELKSLFIKKGLF